MSSVYYLFCCGLAALVVFLFVVEEDVSMQDAKTFVGILAPLSGPRNVSRLS